MIPFGLTLFRPGAQTPRRQHSRRPDKRLTKITPMNAVARSTNVLGSGTVVVTSSSVNSPGELVRFTEAIPESENTRKEVAPVVPSVLGPPRDRKSTRLNSSHRCISYAVFCLD